MRRQHIQHFAARFAPESLEFRTLLSAPEPNNTFATAYTPPDNIYLEQNYNNADSVNPSSDQYDVYKFYTLYGPSHLHANLDGISSGTNADLYAYVYDGGQYNLVAGSTLSGNQSETIDVDLPAFRYFYVVVEGMSGTSNYGLYLYNDYAGATYSTARSIGTSWGQTSSAYYAYNQIFLNDYMDYRDNEDIFKFALEAKGTINIRQLAPVNDGGPALVDVMELFDASGNPLTGAVDDSGGLDIQNFPAKAGTYYLDLRQLSGSGSYGLRIVSDYAGGTTATARDLGDVTNGSRQMTDMVGGPFGFPAYEDPLDLYKIKLDGTAGHPTAPLTLQTDIGGQTAPDFGASLFIAQDTNNDGTIETNERINTFSDTGNNYVNYHGLPAGIYYIGVEPQAFYTTYQLNIDSDVDSVDNNYASLSLANSFGTFTGTKAFSNGFGISPGDISDYYKFTLNSTMTVSAKVANATSISRDPNWIPSLAFVHDDNNNLLADASEYKVRSSSGLITATLNAGTYYLALGSNGEQSNYTGQLTISNVDNDNTISEMTNIANNKIAIGGSIAFTMNPLDDVDLVKFTASAGQSVGFNINSRSGSNLDTYLRLFNTSGTQLAANDNGAAPGESASKFSYLPYTFSSAGTYYLGVSLAPNKNYSANTGIGIVAGTGPTGAYTLLAKALGSISGNVFNDLNANAKKDSTEKGLNGWTAYIDANNNNALDSNEQKTTTDSSGNYKLPFLASGTFKVRVIHPSSWKQTFPTNNAGQSVTLSTGQNVTGKNFGEKEVTGTASIAGNVFDDSNDSGKKDSGESGLSSWTVYIDVDNNGILDSKDKKTGTDSKGNYKFSSLFVGTYKIRVNPPSGWSQSYPGNNSGQSVTVTTGQAVTGKNFGEFPTIE